MTSSISDRPVVEFRGELITRKLGRMNRNHLNNLLEKHESIAVDLSAVEMMTPSFTDECFGMLALAMGVEAFQKRVRLTGATLDLKHLVTAVIGQRLRGGSPPP
jgi:hypothetical protein